MFPVQRLTELKQLQAFPRPVEQLGKLRFGLFFGRDLGLRFRVGELRFQPGVKDFVYELPLLI